MITKEDYFYLTKIVGSAYRGEVEGLGTVMNLPTIVANTTSAQRDSVPKGIFLTTNYVSVIVPTPPPANDPVREYEAEQYIKSKISNTNSDGSIDYLDVNTNKVYKLGKDGWINVDIVGDKISINAVDATHSFKQFGDLDLFMDKFEKAPTFTNFSTKPQEVPIPQQKKPFPSEKVPFDATSIAWNSIRWKLMEAKYRKGRAPILNGVKRATKTKYVYEAKKLLRKYHFPVKPGTSDFLDRVLPTFYKRAGRVLFVTSLVFEGLDVFKNRAFKVSNALDLTMIGVAFIPYVGLPISIAYFLTDLGLMIYNYNQTGSWKGIGDYVNDWVDENGWFENGVIWDLTPLLGPANDSLPIVNPGLTISF